MAQPKPVCRKCPHLRDQHSVYREKCLVDGCTCTEQGGHPYGIDCLNGGS